jgi:DNA-binding sugar fermentation-stimulating protein
MFQISCFLVSAMVQTRRSITSLPPPPPPPKLKRAKRIPAETPLVLRSKLDHFDEPQSHHVTTQSASSMLSVSYELLHSLPTLCRVQVLHRPSKTIKSPYVADILLQDGTQALCHTPALGCGGLVTPGRTILVSKATNPAAKTNYTAQVAECQDLEGTYYVGTHPMISQAMAAKLLDRIHPGVTWKSEVQIDAQTRIDFYGKTTQGKAVYVEVKNAMISHQTEIKSRSQRRAIFPEGYRKSKADTISPRAVKHAQVLGELVTRPETEAAYLVYIVPRHDCQDGLEINPQDPIYCQGVAHAMSQGVQVRVFGLHFDDQGVISLDRPLPFYCVAP